MSSLQVIPVAVIFGATACGKTALAARLFSSTSSIGDSSNNDILASVIGKVEIISADSVQVYRGMPIGSAQPPRELLHTLPHHLIGICNPSEEFSVADFVHRADTLCKDITACGKHPVILGGTAFYLKHFMYGMPDTPQADPTLRTGLQKKLRKIGTAAMYAELKTFDPISAAKIHINDEYRIIRAHEVYMTSGKPLSSFQIPYRYRNGFRFCPIFLDRPREELYRRIEIRVDKMIAEGLQQEIAQLVKQGCTAEYPAMKAIGYREFFTLSPDAPAAAPLEAVRLLIKRNSKRYAKRQQTFFQSFPNTHYINMEKPDNEQCIIDILRHFYTEVL